MFSPFFAISSSSRPLLLPLGMPTVPTPDQFWAMMLWVVLPSLLTIWMAYHHHQEKMRRVHRRMRLLEARLASATPAQATLRTSFPRNPGTATRPVALTARIPAPAPAMASPFARVVTGPV